MLERLAEEIKRRVRVVRVLPIAASLVRLVRARGAPMHVACLEDTRYINTVLLMEQKRAAMKIAARSAQRQP
jgi:transposase-like protein